MYVCKQVHLKITGAFLKISVTILFIVVQINLSFEGKSVSRYVLDQTHVLHDKYIASAIFNQGIYYI